MSEPIEIDPPRLRDDPTLPPAIGSALAAGRGYAPSAEARARTLAALGVGAAVATTATATSATAATVASPGAAKVLLGWKALAGIAALAIGLGTFGWFALRGPSAPTAPTTAEATATAAVVATSSAVNGASAEPNGGTAPAEEIAPIVGSASPTSPAGATKPNSFKPKGAGSGDNLAAEVAAIDGARNALRSGDPAGALRLLDAYGRDFPKGSLGLEGQVLRIEALAASGQKPKARALAERFLAAHPNSVLAPRLKAVLQP